MKRLIFLALFGSAGCVAATLAPPTNPCSVTGQDGQPPSSSLLLFVGKSRLSDGLASVNSGTKQPYRIAPLVAAAECYSRALQRAPDNYEATMGLAATYIALTIQLSSESSERVAAISSAKRMLGKAYALRQGAFEPLYYLAELALIEGDEDRALRFLTKMESKPAGPQGPVLVLIGHIYERKKNRAKAQEYYERALSVGWPRESVAYAAFRLDDMGVGPSSGGGDW